MFKFHNFEYLNFCNSEFQKHWAFEFSDFQILNFPKFQISVFSSQALIPKIFFVVLSKYYRLHIFQIR
ncbi:Protein CBG26847 [Caenorhabditis briggsae]|uniref:Protein CBG26847 n=1 Tax=Caenorhabditis briggsae TaxID=6238 RepID=B6ILS1_CAEBR|nr:Protein CBG26847 [Caenorhabditis briggsae]CAS00851.1 Protein CBG26847 [Caenorhabditis briggsae]